MYCNIDEVIRVCLILEQRRLLELASGHDGGNDNDDRKKIMLAYEKIQENM